MKEKKYNISAALEELEPNLIKDTELIYQLKTGISKLDSTNKTILMLYLELQSMSKVGKVLNVSPSTVYIYIKKIRGILLENIKGD